jgi:hypothetical protein
MDNQGIFFTASLVLFSPSRQSGQYLAIIQNPCGSMIFFLRHFLLTQPAARNSHMRLRKPFTIPAMLQVQPSPWFAHIGRARRASSLRPIMSQSRAYSFPYNTNIPPINTDSATPPFLFSVVCKRFVRISGKTIGDRSGSQFQSALPIRGNPCGPRLLTTWSKERLRCSKRRSCFLPIVSKGTVFI